VLDSIIQYLYSIDNNTTGWTAVSLIYIEWILLYSAEMWYRHSDTSLHKTSSTMEGDFFFVCVWSVDTYLLSAQQVTFIFICALLWHFSHYIWPYSGSSYEIIIWSTKCTVPRILNKNKWQDPRVFHWA
jgi:hypothetical protein